MVDTRLAWVHATSDRYVHRVASAWAITAAALDHYRPAYVAFSGGKDSTVILHLVHSLAPEIPVVWSDDELELPDTVSYQGRIREAVEHYGVVAGQGPHAGWFHPWQKRPWMRQPAADMEWLVLPMRQAVADIGFRMVFLGLRGEENQRRRAWLLKTGHSWIDRWGVRNVCPLYDWTADDVWTFIATQGLDYNSAYDVMERIGVPRKLQRVGPLPLARRADLKQGWPKVLQWLEQTHGKHWQ
jgi:3'-phosphoadenosine 5'-phosphosulfate sulfotransferase (PAPS reductase)/FAD synthetase